LMPLDGVLNKDVGDAVKRHVNFTKHLPGGKAYDSGPLGADGRPVKFDRSTPKRQTHAYLRLLDPANPEDGGALTSVRIIQDVDRCIGHLLPILGAGGAIVPGLGSRNGHRKITAVASLAASENNGHGGHRVKGDKPTAGWILPEVRPHRDAFRQQSAAKAAKAT
jgi:hypothetical protein